MVDHQILIAGGGPTGLMLGAELALAGVDAAIIEQRENHDLTGSRAGGLHARTLEVLDQRGVVDRFLVEGQRAQTAGFAGYRLDISDLPTRYPYTLGLWQTHIERILLGWVEELGVPVLRGREVTGLQQDEASVEVRLADGSSLRAAYLVGCDGVRSVVRKAAGIGFPGVEPTISHVLAEVELAEEPTDWGVGTDAIGLHSLGRLDYEIRDGKLIFADEGPVRAMVTERSLPHDGGPATLEDLRAGLIAHYGTDFGVHSPSWITRFTDMARQADRYRNGRVLLAGDAAHVHYPAGGHGLNTGMQDAVNLGWKLALVANGTAPESLLDTYHAERHPVAARVLRETLAAVAANRQDARSQALREIVTELLALDPARKQMAGRVSELDIRYELGKGHPLLGARMPDLDIVTPDGPSRVYALLHHARPVLLIFGGAAGFDVAGWADRVLLMQAEAGENWQLPVVGAVPAPDAVLIRPDGHVAWVGEDGQDGLTSALAKWFGPPSA